MSKRIIILIPLLALACSLSAKAPQSLGPAQAVVKATQGIQGIQLVPLETAMQDCTVTAVETLNLRATPGTDAAVIAILKHGDLLTILPDPAQGNWIHVQAQDRAGWINSNYCKESTSEH